MFQSPFSSLKVVCSVWTAICTDRVVPFSRLFPCSWELFNGFLHALGFSSIYRSEARAGVWNPLMPFLLLSWYQQRTCAEAFLVVVYRGLHLKDERPASTEQKLRSVVTAFVWICNQKVSEFSSLLWHYMICWVSLYRKNSSYYSCY